VGQNQHNIFVPEVTAVYVPDLGKKC